MNWEFLANIYDIANKRWALWIYALKLFSEQKVCSVLHGKLSKFLKSVLQLCAQRLNASNNEIVELKEDTFSRNLKIWKIVLSENKIKQFPVNLFRYTQGLQVSAKFVPFQLMRSPAKTTQKTPPVKLCKSEITFLKSGE